jgi:hypothetical protein
LQRERLHPAIRKDHGDGVHPEDSLVALRPLVGHVNIQYHDTRVYPQRIVDARAVDVPRLRDRRADVREVDLQRVLRRISDAPERLLQGVGYRLVADVRRYGEPDHLEVHQVILLRHRLDGQAQPVQAGRKALQAFQPLYGKPSCSPSIPCYIAGIPDWHAIILALDDANELRRAYHQCRD